MEAYPLDELMNDPMAYAIACQECGGQERPQGCSFCSGFGVVLEQRRCPQCDREAWFRPGSFTKYEGKQYWSFDGLKFVAHLNRPDNCIACEK